MISHSAGEIIICLELKTTVHDMFNVYSRKNFNSFYWQEINLGWT